VLLVIPTPVVMFYLTLTENAFYVQVDAEISFNFVKKARFSC